MYGYTQTGLEVEGSNFATLTGTPIPAEFKQTIIPSLLFGSLISATDPGIIHIHTPPLLIHTYIHTCTHTVEPPNNGYVGDESFVHCLEVVPSSEVEMYGQCRGRGQTL